MPMSQDYTEVVKSSFVPLLHSTDYAHELFNWNLIYRNIICTFFYNYIAKIAQIETYFTTPHIKKRCSVDSYCALFNNV